MSELIKEISETMSEITKLFLQIVEIDIELSKRKPNGFDTME